MRSEFVSLAIGVLLATLCTAQNRATTPVPIRCLNGRIVSPVNGSQHCECNPGFSGYACDQPVRTTKPPIRCVNGVIDILWNFGQRCVCNPGFTGLACDLDGPLGQLPLRESQSSSPRITVFIIVPLSVFGLIVIAAMLVRIFKPIRRVRQSNQQSAVHARRLPRDLRTGLSHGIYAIPGDLDVKLPPYTPPKSPPPYAHQDYIKTGLVCGKDSIHVLNHIQSRDLSTPPPPYTLSVTDSMKGRVQ